MRVPIRRAQQAKQRDGQDGFYITRTGLERLKRTLANLEARDLPQAIEDVSRSVQLGDLSENAEYQEAKHRLARIHGRIFSLNDRITHALVIDEPIANGRIQLGSTVTVRSRNRQQTYQLVGPRETNPSQGRISHLSPLGAALIGHMTGESVTIQTDKGETRYEILKS